MEVVSMCSVVPILGFTDPRSLSLSSTSIATLNLRSNPNRLSKAKVNDYSEKIESIALTLAAPPVVVLDEHKRQTEEVTDDDDDIDTTHGPYSKKGSLGEKPDINDVPMEESQADQCALDIYVVLAMP
ncbi:hypothetical protein Droror1_Dr00011994 [Drosera rotundifolia]